MRGRAGQGRGLMVSVDSGVRALKGAWCFRSLRAEQSGGVFSWSRVRERHSCHMPCLGAATWVQVGG